MAITYSLGFDPFWYIADLVGRPLAGGSMYTYRSLAKTTPKFIYQSASNNNPWPNPVIFDENGQQGPFYFAFDSATPEETYYIEVYDSSGNLVWDLDNYIAPGSGGGGSGGSVINSTNLVVNGVFWRNTGDTANPIAATYTLLAPGCHAGLALTANNAGPDIVFLKNNLSATDRIQFVNFTQGTQPLTGDVTPVQFFRYSCTGAGTGETQKCIQIPITAKIQNLTNIVVTVTLWARSSSLSQIVLQWLQYLGDGVSVNAPVPLGVQTLTASWTKYQFQVTVPDVTAFTLGGCGNDGLFLQIQMPLSATCVVDLIEPSIFIGDKVPPNSFLVYDQIDGMLNVPRTGDIRPSYGLIPPGWVSMNDGSIGNTLSLATNRANIDTFPLYNMLYTNVIDAWAPVSGGRSGTASTDFLANKRLTLTRQMGRAIAAFGQGSGLSNRVLGQYTGDEIVVLTTGEVPNLLVTVTGNTPSGPGAYVATNQVFTDNGASGGTFSLTSHGTTTNGGGGAHENMQPTVFSEFMIKL